jgi:hypothetical protein
MRLFKVLTLPLLATLLLAIQPPALAAKSLLNTTATTGGTDYPGGVAIGTLISITLAA